MRPTRQFLIGVTFCVTFCGVALAALAPFDVSPVAPTRQQDQSAALHQARAHCVQSLSSAVVNHTAVGASEARDIATTRCELLFAPDPIAKLTIKTDNI
ncbi:MAG: hypothetical protein P1U65_18960 [Minwuia sp.]|nr:hypothetical protein [Minwuia sp.]